MNKPVFPEMTTLDEAGSVIYWTGVISHRHEDPVIRAESKSLYWDVQYWARAELDLEI